MAKIWKIASVGSLMLALTPVAAFRNLRNAYVDELSKRIAVLVEPQYLMVGDSLTANGQPWGWRLSWNPFSAVVVARSGARTDQLAGMMKEAPAVHQAFVMLGTNDVGDSVPLARFVENYRRVLGHIHAENVTVTLIPPTGDLPRNAIVKRYNAAMLPLLRERRFRIIDLSKDLAPSGRPDPTMFVDGIHFTEKAYVIWTEKLKHARH